LVVERSLAESRARAQALILAGWVLVDDVPAEKPGTRVSADAALRLRGQVRAFVSRGGEKLAGALVDLAPLQDVGAPDAASIERLRAVAALYRTELLEGLDPPD